MIENKIMNILGKIADGKIETACIGWSHNPKPPAELLKPKEEKK